MTTLLLESVAVPTGPLTPREVCRYLNEINRHIAHLDAEAGKLREDLHRYTIARSALVIQRGMLIQQMDGPLESSLAELSPPAEPPSIPPACAISGCRRDPRAYRVTPRGIRIGGQDYISPRLAEFIGTTVMAWANPPTLDATIWTLDGKFLCMAPVIAGATGPAADVPTPALASHPRELHLDRSTSQVPVEVEEFDAERWDGIENGPGVTP